MCESLGSRFSLFYLSCWFSFGRRQFENYGHLTSSTEKTFCGYFYRCFIDFKTFFFSHTCVRFFSLLKTKTNLLGRSFF